MEKFWRSSKLVQSLISSAKQCLQSQKILESHDELSVLQTQKPKPPFTKLTHQLNHSSNSSRRAQGPMEIIETPKTYIKKCFA